MKIKGSSNERTTGNLFKNDANFQQEKTRQKIASKLDLGGSWAPFGRGLGRSGPSFGHSWALLGRFGWVRGRAFIEHWSKIGSKRPSGSILGGSWKGLGRFGG